MFSGKNALCHFSNTFFPISQIFLLPHKHSASLSFSLSNTQTHTRTNTLSAPTSHKVSEFSTHSLPLSHYISPLLSLSPIVFLSRFLSLPIPSLFIPLFLTPTFYLSLPLRPFTSLHLFFFLFLYSLSFLPFSLSSLPLSFSRNVHYRFCNMIFKVKSNLPFSSV